MYRDFHIARVAQEVTQFSLVKMGLALQRILQECLDDISMEPLVTTSHITEGGAEHEVGQNGAKPRQKTPSWAARSHTTTVDIAAAEGTFVALVQHPQEHGQGTRVMAQAGIHLDDELMPLRQCMAVSIKVGIDHIAVLGTEYGLEPRILQLKCLGHGQGTISADSVDDEVNGAGGQTVEHGLEGRRERLKLLLFVGHRDDDRPVVVKIHRFAKYGNYLMQAASVVFGPAMPNANS